MKVYNQNSKHVPKSAVYIGRPSKFSNPFEIDKDGTRKQVLEKYRKYLVLKPELVLLAKTELKGRDLICWCSPLPCHGNILMAIANKPEEQSLFD